MGAKYLILQELWRKKACFCGILIEVILPSFSGDAGCRKITLHDWRIIVSRNSVMVKAAPPRACIQGAVGVVPISHTWGNPLIAGSEAVTEFTEVSIQMATLTAALSLRPPVPASSGGHRASRSCLGAAGSIRGSRLPGHVWTGWRTGPAVGRFRHSSSRATSRRTRCR